VRVRAPPRQVRRGEAKEGGEASLVGRKVAKTFLGYGRGIEDMYHGEVTGQSDLDYKYEVWFEGEWGSHKCKWDKKTVEKYLVKEEESAGAPPESSAEPSNTRRAGRPNKDGLYSLEPKVFCALPFDRLREKLKIQQGKFPFERYSVFGEVAITVDSADVTGGTHKKQLEAQEFMRSARKEKVLADDSRFKAPLGGGVACKVEIFDTKSKRGWGVRALQDIKANEEVMEYVGQAVSRGEAKKREALYQNEIHGTYMFDLPPTGTGHFPSWVIDATQVGNAARFINHGCGATPNLKTEGFLACAAWLNQLKEKAVPLRIALVATRDITAGEELLYEYNEGQGEAVAGPETVKCCCGDPACKNVVF